MAKTTGIIRKMDNLGRIVLPIEIRRTLNISRKDEVEICLESGKIILQKHEPNCIFCQGSKDIIKFKEKNICRVCLHEICQ